jgi:hypothetical protein
MINKQRTFIVIGGKDFNSAEQISQFKVTERVMKEDIVPSWHKLFPCVSYFEVNWKHSDLLQKIGGDK